MDAQDQGVNFFLRDVFCHDSQFCNSYMNFKGYLGDFVHLTSISVSGVAWEGVQCYFNAVVRGQRGSIDVYRVRPIFHEEAGHISNRVIILVRTCVVRSGVASTAVIVGYRVVVADFLCVRRRVSLLVMFGVVGEGYDREHSFLRITVEVNLAWMCFRVKGATNVWYDVVRERTCFAFERHSN